MCKMESKLKGRQGIGQSEKAWLLNQKHMLTKGQQ